MDLIFPAQSPKTLDDVEAFMFQNDIALRQLTVQVLAEELANIPQGEIHEKAAAGEKEHGPWSPFKLDPRQEARKEAIDMKVYVAWEALQKHFSEPQNSPEPREV